MMLPAVQRHTLVALVIIGVTLPHPSIASNWVSVAASPDGLVEFYVDAANIRGSARRSVRLLYEYQQVQQDPDTFDEHRSSVVSAVIDCLKPQIAVTKIENFVAPMGRGRPTNRSGGTKVVMEPVADDGINAQIRKAVCIATPSRAR